MDLNNIEKLIEKYNSAETTLQEEAELKAYFKSNNVAPHLEHYKPMFLFFSESKKEQYTKDVPLNTKKTKLYQWISVAAVAVLMLGFFIPNWSNEPKTLADYTPEEQELYLETKQTLSLISKNLNKGLLGMNALDMTGENLNMGLEKASYITVFGDTTNKLLKN
ncbi:hypothetical protein HSX10_11670 [Winogradskyella undariae]|uniref:hypothetical protein n=1 Tax=Winogradskyella TaxID=286104 RepID=UPI00156B8952|nr:MULTISPECIES: hypothetical protein [Winogradskyella]NRR92226.1 hypothetical protein [Winogradskyella undariae]QXP78251.1 hypothetical protein H0I32_13630 [Winogradskyella sp. HaHa_3_26]